MAQSERIKYSVVEGWEQLPKGYFHREVAGVAVEGEDRVYLICCGDHPVIIYGQQGNYSKVRNAMRKSSRVTAVAAALLVAGLACSSAQAQKTIRPSRSV